MALSPSHLSTRYLRSSLKNPIHPTKLARRLYQIERFQSSGFTPPSPSSLGRPKPARSFPRTRKWTRRSAYLALLTALGYALDKHYNASSLIRSFRTFSLGFLVACDYKINFRENPPFADSVAEVHDRNARKLFDLLRENGGLYLKIGQAIAMQSAILPPEFQKMFARMFDDAPQNTWDEVQKVIREDFGGRSVEDVFGVSFSGDPELGVMERTAKASASVAQVHWARLKDGREVAIKIQKREIERQVGWDLWAFRVVTWVYSKWFDLPFYSLVPFISERLLLETDFLNEADNSVRMAELIKGEPRLRERVYIPRVYRELSSKRVMTAEWVEGIRLWDREGITRPWKGGNDGSPGCHGAPLDPPGKPIQVLQRNSHSDQLKPDRDWWRGPDGDGGLGLSLTEVMKTMVDLFAAQMFLWGWVHCDPHPGNIFIRRLANGRSELVLIDHGLYVHMNPKFRQQYSLFWKSLMTFDNQTMKEVVGEWGVNNADIFASATLMRPYSGGDGSVDAKIRGLSEQEKKKRQFEMQQAMRKGVRDILGDETKWPRELIFIGRNMRIVQGNNQYLGSPVNRIKITGSWASRALSEDMNRPWSERWKFYGSHLIFKLVLLATDVVFYAGKVRQYFGTGKGMEDDIENHMKRMAMDAGFDLNHGVFEG